MLSEITPLILTLNEAPNIQRLLASLEWAQEVVVLDSFSTDATESIARSYPNVTFACRPFDSFADQCNAGLDRIRSEWVLSLDADYVVTDELRDEIGRLRGTEDVSAYVARFRYCIAGRPLRASLYPPRPILFRKSKARYVQDGHAHRLVVDGPSQFLQGRVLHDDRKPHARWLESQRHYARQEARKLIEHSGGPLSPADRLRRAIWPAAPAAFIYTLLVKGCLFDGWPGWYYALQRTYAELLLSLELLDRRISQRDDQPTDMKIGDAPRQRESQTSRQVEATSV
jgi:glycosyltransferase involved in cell wall biosynthesis